MPAATVGASEQVTGSGGWHADPMPSTVPPFIADAFIEMAHRIVWASVATVDHHNRPRSRVLHPLWERQGDDLVGWVATGPTPTKLAHLAHSPFVSVNYWSTDQDTCVAECNAEWITDDASCIEMWDRFKNAPPPVGYDPAIIPPWKNGPTSPAFAILKLDPWRVRVFPGSVLMGTGGEVLTWTQAR